MVQFSVSVQYTIDVYHVLCGYSPNIFDRTNATLTRFAVGKFSAVCVLLGYFANWGSSNCLDYLVWLALDYSNCT